MSTRATKEKKKPVGAEPWPWASSFVLIPEVGDACLARDYLQGKLVGPLTDLDFAP